MHKSKQFSFDTIQDFDDHIERSIPNYDLLFETILNVVPFFAKKETSIVDLGCSTGNLLSQIKHDGKKIGVDLSENLLPSSSKDVYFERVDIVDYVPPRNCSMIFSIFTLQFINQKDRKKVLEKVFDALEPGGAFVWAEKVISETGFWEQVQTFSYYDFKQKSFDPVEILNKEKSLRSIMRPLTSKQNQRLAKNAGFPKGEMIWKFHNFEMWIYVKGVI